MQTESSHLPAIEITARAARRLAGGYLWVFSNEIVPREDLPQTASWCRFARNGNTVAVGYFNRHSLIAGRALAYGEKSDIQQLMIARLRQAFARRRPFAMGQAVRLVYSEADLLPGLVIDYYPPYAVIQSNTAGMDLMLPLLEEITAEVLEEVLETKIEGLVVRGDSAVRQLEGIASFTRVAFGNRDAMTQARRFRKTAFFMRPTWCPDRRPVFFWTSATTACDWVHGCRTWAAAGSWIFFAAPAAGGCEPCTPAPSW